MNKFDVAIVGGGPVGAALVIALARGGLRIAIIEGRQPTLAPNNDWDARVYALSPGNHDFVTQLDAWHHIADERVCPILGMQVWGDDNIASIQFDTRETGRNDLGCIIEAGRLQTALWNVVCKQPNVTVLCPMHCHSLSLNAVGAKLELENSQTIEAELVVGADGPDSWVRKTAGFFTASKPYEQSGVVANFYTELPHAGIARQWFRKDGVLAWLPLSGNYISIVWSAQTAVAKELLTLTPEIFCQRVAEAGNNILGKLTLVTPPSAFPLRLIELPSTVKTQVALIGDAAHVVHPLAGQGVNLGLRDAQKLAQVILSRNQYESIGDYALLRRYERARREDWIATKWVTDGLHTLFHPEYTALKKLRNFGLASMNRLPNIKRHFIAHAIQ